MADSKKAISCQCKRMERPRCNPQQRFATVVPMLRRVDVPILQCPALPVFVMKQFVGVRIVGEFQILAIPDQLGTAIANADTAQQHCFGEWAGKIKIRARGLAAAFARLEPFLMMPDRTLCAELI